MSHPLPLRTRREALVLEHMAAESEHDMERALGTFHQARYEVMPTGETHCGDAAVMAFYRESEQAFSDFRFDNQVLHHAENSVVVEVDFVGTHDGPWRGLPATGRPVRYRMCNIFIFEKDELVCERLYFDLQGVLQQLGIARDPTTTTGRLNTFVSHPLVVGLAFARSLWRR